MRGDDFFRQVALQPPFSSLHPKLAAFFKDYLSNEKITPFGGRFVLNTHFPPFPSPAFDRMAEQFNAVGKAGDERRLFSVTWAVTNRCAYKCWHCYNSGRSARDLPLEAIKKVADQLQALGAVVVTLTGGEPLLRGDIAEIAGFFDDRASLVLGSTGDGLSAALAGKLKDNGIFALGISLDSSDEAEHDTLRGRKGAFRTALSALKTAEDAGLYPYVVSVATREFLERPRFMNFLAFARDAGAKEIHMLEPSATGRLSGRQDVMLNAAERRMILDYQCEISRLEDMPALSSFLYLESESAFGCGAGLTHLYIDGSGEVCPCNLVPLSFGNVMDDSLEKILGRMGVFFRQPRCDCVGRMLSGRVTGNKFPAPPRISEEICGKHLPPEHPVPLFFSLRSASLERVGRKELRESYNKVHGDYNEFWVSEAGRPVGELIKKLALKGDERVFEAGCGTGHATGMLAGLVRHPGSITAADISEGMIEQARAKVGNAPHVEFIIGDALELLGGRPGRFDLIFSSWVLGYIPLAPFFSAAASALAPGGRLAFIVHRKNSPRRELEIFGRLVAEDPSCLLRQVDFDFPEGAEQAKSLLEASGLECESIGEGKVVFNYPDSHAVLEHLLKSGAGTAFYDSIEPSKRPILERRFLESLDALNLQGRYAVEHEFVACVARKPVKK